MKKRIMKILTALSVVAVITVGGTLAYLHTITETKSNVFSSDKNISIQLREPAWDGYTFEDLNPGDGTTAKEGLTEEELKNLGLTQAGSYVPGQEIPKNPMVRNDGDENAVDSWVALRVQYFQDDGTEVDYKTFKDQYLEAPGLEFDSNWIPVPKDTGDNSRYDLFRYKDIVTRDGQGSVTTPLFEKVPLSFDLEPIQKVVDGQTVEKLPTFKIVIKAYAIQSMGIDETRAETELYKFVKQNMD